MTKPEGLERGIYVLQQVALGRSQQEIANELGVSKTRIQQIIHKAYRNPPNYRHWVFQCIIDDIESH